MDPYLFRALLAQHQRLQELYKTTGWHIGLLHVEDYRKFFGVAF
jgi:hypothetical protein